MAIEVIVNGTSFQLFKQVDVSRNLDEMLADSRIILSEQVAGQSFIKAQDEVQIRFDGVPRITGFIDNISENQSNDTHDVNYRLRDKLSDLVDSSVPDNVKSLDGVTSLAQLCQLCIDGLNLDIQVIDEAGITFDDELKAAEVGQNCGDFLQQYARKAGVFIGSNGEGNLVILKPSGEVITNLINIPGSLQNNIENINLDIDYTQRFYRYIVRSGDNMGEAFDDEIRTTRSFEKIAETPMTAAECQRAAAEESNIRRIDSFSYSCQVAGFSGNGQIWEPGKLANVKDSERNISGKYLMKDVTLTGSSSGEVATIKLTYQDAYQATATLGAIQARAGDPQEVYIIQSGDTLAGIAARFGVPLADVIEANPQIEQPRLIFPGGQVRIPSS